MVDEPNPALVPGEPASEEKQYIVSGTAAVLEHQIGEVFAATFTPEQEEFYLSGGHLKVYTPSEGESTPEDTEPESTDGEQE